MVNSDKSCRNIQQNEEREVMVESFSLWLDWNRTSGGARAEGKQPKGHSLSRAQSSLLCALSTAVTASCRLWQKIFKSLKHQKEMICQGKPAQGYLMCNGIISGFYLNSKILGAGNQKILPLSANLRQHGWVFGIQSCCISQNCTAYGGISCL